MAIFNKKENTDNQKVTVQDTPTTDEITETEAKAPQLLDVAHSGIGNKGLIVPRVSEKAGFVDRFNQYIFTVYGKLNKVEVRRAIEKMYGVKVANVNMVNVAGKKRRFGPITGQRSGFKKAIITLTKDSKKINIVEPT
ncbi:MAG TPA: 50S ribosomal protein L23 [Candidatus Doudnabacteria bacterium]|nr:50S ribosomal protein L23 [Candidatus Doudnabacteria bacterium]